MVLSDNIPESLARRLQLKLEVMSSTELIAAFEQIWAEELAVIDEKRGKLKQMAHQLKVKAKSGGRS